MNGATLALGLAAHHVPVDAGRVTITVTTPEHAAWTTTLTVGPRQTRAVSIPPPSELKRPAFAF